MTSRIAPTPSGFLHRGNAFNALLVWVLTRSAGGSLRLRIDDLDAPRVRLEYVQSIFSTLRWIGIDWDAGPQNAADHDARYTQHLRLDRYNEIVDALAGRGFLFACKCSRQEIRSSGAACPRGCITQPLPLDEPDASLRLRTSPESLVSFTDALLGEQTVSATASGVYPVIRRRDGLPAYHIATLADDMDYGITHIVRGADLLPATALQLQLAKLLDLECFTAITFYHHPLLPAKDGAKLSKSTGASAVRNIHPAESSAALLHDFCHWNGWPVDDVHSTAHLLPLFRAYGFAGLRR